MNKNGIFLVVFLLLLGLPIYSPSSINTGITTEPIETHTTTAVATSGTLRILVTEDVTVINGSAADTNFDALGALITGCLDSVEAQATRAWLKFDLAILPQELSIQRATINAQLMSEYAEDDKPLGIYHCSDDSWVDSAITWNTQPTFSPTYSDVIDSPASPDMFANMKWYSWDVTSDARGSMNQGDMILSEVMKQVDETGPEPTFKAWTEMDTYVENATFLEIEYTAPTTINPTVDGIASGPMLDYINSDVPELGWQFTDPDYNDFQKDYDVELWNDAAFLDSLLWCAGHEYVTTVHNSFGDGIDGTSHPFGVRDEVRLQMKYLNTELPRSGILDKLYLTARNDTGNIQIEDLEISMAMVTDGGPLGSSFDANFDGVTPTVVLSSDLYNAEVIDGVIEIDVVNTFMVVENWHLVIQIRLMDNTGDIITLNRTTSGGPGYTAGLVGTGAYVSPISGYENTRTYDLRLGFLTQTVYTGDEFHQNAYPFATTVGEHGRFQIKYNQSYVNRAGYLDRAYIRVDTFSGDVVYENFIVKLVESPVIGYIDNGTWTANYGGATAYTVLDESEYTVKNLGGCLVIDFDNSFYYTNTHDLLIDLQWDSLVSGHSWVFFDESVIPGYRAWDVHFGIRYEGNGTAGYDLMLDFVNDDDSVPLEGCFTLVNGTDYYWRVRTCDSTGMWGDWTTQAFKYEIITSIPSYNTLVVTPSPAYVDQEVTVSLNVTHVAGVNDVTLEMDSAGYAMTADGDTYSYSFTPTAAGTINFTIYMQSNADTWANVTGSVTVLPAGAAGDLTMILIIVGAAAVVIIIIVIVMKKKK